MRGSLVRGERPQLGIGSGAVAGMGVLAGVTGGGARLVDGEF